MEVSGQEPRTRIEHGQPMGQLYGFGLQWKDKVDMKITSANEASPIDDMSRDEARAGYSVGPPYIATGALFVCMLLCVVLLEG
jgi:hypothetical protein